MFQEILSGLKISDFTIINPHKRSAFVLANDIQFLSTLGKRDINFQWKIPGFITYFGFNCISLTDMCIITKSSKSDGDKNLAQDIHEILLGKC